MFLSCQFRAPVSLTSSPIESCVHIDILKAMRWGHLGHLGSFWGTTSNVALSPKSWSKKVAVRWFWPKMYTKTVLTCQFGALLQRCRPLNVCFHVAESVKTRGRPLLTTLQVPPKSYAFAIFCSRKTSHLTRDGPVVWKRSKSGQIK